MSNPSTGAFLHRVDAWGFPKYPDRTLTLPPDADLTASLEAFVGANMPLLKETNCWLGTWVYPATQDIYLDVTTSCKELHETLRAAARINAVSKRRIVAAHNSSRDETVYL